MPNKMNESILSDELDSSSTMQVRRSFVLDNVVATCTGLSVETRSELANLITKMGGKMSSDFDETVTHLIAENCDTRSAKYEAARKRKIPVMLPMWIYRMNDAEDLMNLEIMADTSDQQATSVYRTPLFAGCEITVSGFMGNERVDIGRLVELHGGVFSAQMSKATCTHLITATNSGEKYRRAKEWATIHIVSSRWLRKSIELEYRMPEDKFSIEEFATPILKSEENTIQNHIIPDSTLSKMADMADICSVLNEEKPEENIPLEHGCADPPLQPEQEAEEENNIPMEDGPTPLLKPEDITIEEKDGVEKPEQAEKEDDADRFGKEEYRMPEDKFSIEEFTSPVFKSEENTIQNHITPSATVPKMGDNCSISDEKIDKPEENVPMEHSCADPPLQQELAAEEVYNIPMEDGPTPLLKPEDIAIEEEGRVEKPAHAEKEDDADRYGKKLANFLRRFGPKKQLQIQMKFDQLMFEYMPDDE